MTFDRQCSDGPKGDGWWWTYRISLLLMSNISSDFDKKVGSSFILLNLQRKMLSLATPSFSSSSLPPIYYNHSPPKHHPLPTINIAIITTYRILSSSSLLSLPDIEFEELMAHLDLFWHLGQSSMGDAQHIDVSKIDEQIWRRCEGIAPYPGYLFEKLSRRKRR